MKIILLLLSTYDKDKNVNIQFIQTQFHVKSKDIRKDATNTAQ